MRDSDQLIPVPKGRSRGFDGYRTVRSLRNKGVDAVPEEPGVYRVMRPGIAPPRFLAQGAGAWFKGKDPNVPLSRLQQEWVESALVLYIGRAGADSNETLRKRIDLLIRFGEGEPVGHYGGRLVWQLNDADALVICWQATYNKDPQEVKRELIQNFRMLHGGKRPFANLQD